MTTVEIKGLVDSLNNGGATPDNVEKISINKKNGVFSVIYIKNQGVYIVDRGEPILTMSAEEAEQHKNGNYGA